MKIEASIPSRLGVCCLLSEARRPPKRGFLAESESDSETFLHLRKPCRVECWDSRMHNNNNDNNNDNIDNDDKMNGRRRKLCHAYKMHRIHSGAENSDRYSVV